MQPIDPFSAVLGRRELLRLGAFGAGGLTLARALELLESSPLRTSAPKAKSAILLWLDGGASHIDTFDPKPDAPEEIRGRGWSTVPTPIPNVVLGQHMERIAAVLPQCALIRSLTSDAGEHEIARHLMLTGYPVSPAVEYPSYGSVVSERCKDSAFPPYLAMSQIAEHARQLGPGFLPQECAPFLMDANPARAEFSVRDLDTPAGLSAERVTRRRALTEKFDAFRKQYETNEFVRARGTAFERAYQLIASKPSREAFDLKKEPQSTRDEYGDHSLGQSCLLARRLVEAGARFVTIMDSGWDTHGRNFEQLSLHRLPKLDQAFPMLLRDLDRRGLLDETLILVMGDFGRTPKLNANDGRDHWPRANCALLAGAGVKGGVVHGATDDRAEQVVENPVTPADLAATLYTILGIDPAGELHTRDARPIRLVNNGNVVKEILK
jgi:hypothetical protein